MKTLPYDVALTRLRAGDRLIVARPNPLKITESETYTFEGGGMVSPTTWAKLLPDLEPIGDALFPELGSQTYTLAEAPK